MKGTQDSAGTRRAVKARVSGGITLFLGIVFAIITALLAYAAVATFKESRVLAGLVLVILAAAVLFPAIGGITGGIKRLREADNHVAQSTDGVESLARDGVRQQSSEALSRSQIAAEVARRQEEFIRSANAIPQVEVEIAEVPAEENYIKAAREQPFTNITKKSSIERLSNFVALDVETTGLYPSKAEIVEVSAIRFRDFEPVENFTTLCYPRKGINPEAERVNGISAEMVEGKPVFGQVAASLQAFIGEDNLVAHNLDFDLSFIVKHGVDISGSKRKYYDTLMLAEYVLNQNEVINFKLPTLCRYYNIPYAAGHHSTIDAYAVGLLFRKLAEEKSGQKFEAVALSSS